MTSDIRNDDDIKLLVDKFYDKIGRDPDLGPIFNDVAKVDWNTHLPTMYSFWASLLLSAKSYRGQPFPKHAVLPGLSKGHFHQWLALFSQTVTELFSGPVADHALYRAGLIASVFQSKLGITDTDSPTVIELPIIKE